MKLKKKHKIGIGVAALAGLLAPVIPNRVDDVTMQYRSILGHIPIINKAFPSWAQTDYAAGRETRLYWLGKSLLLHKDTKRGRPADEGAEMVEAYRR